MEFFSATCKLFQKTKCPCILLFEMPCHVFFLFPHDAFMVFDGCHGKKGNQNKIGKKLSRCFMLGNAFLVKCFQNNYPLGLGG
jgi:hypothetical protein